MYFKIPLSLLVPFVSAHSWQKFWSSNVSSYLKVRPIYFKPIKEVCNTEWIQGTKYASVSNAVCPSWLFQIQKYLQVITNCCSFSINKNKRPSCQKTDLESSKRNGSVYGQTVFTSNLGVNQWKPKEIWRNAQIFFLNTQYMSQRYQWISHLHLR